MNTLTDLPQNSKVPVVASEPAILKWQNELRLGNRKIISDHYFHLGVSDDGENFQNKVFIRLGARKNLVFRNISFTHSIFESCYVTNCHFDNCDFTGCRFVGSSFHQSAFSGCKFWYVTFERTQIDDDILSREAPAEENLRMRFARTLRMNFSQLGDAKAVNQAISVELEATQQYLRNSWSSKRNSYYVKKYPGWKQIWQFFWWCEFKLLDILWGNGESIIKLIRSITLAVVFIVVYDVFVAGNPLDLAAYWNSVKEAPAVFLGVIPKNYSPLALAVIAGGRYISLALLTALLVKRFGRR